MSSALFEPSALAELEPFFAHPMTVPFQHVDAAGIVFYARLFEYFHDCYAAFLASVGQPLHLAIRERRWAAPLVRSQADFQRPLRFGDEVVVGLQRARWDRQQLTMGYRVIGVDGKTAAVGHNVHAFVDLATFKRTDPPADLKAAMEELSLR